MFFLWPVRVEDSSGREAVPFVNSVLIAINVMIFFFCGPHCLGLAVGHGSDFWTILLHAFGHFGPAHLLGNMWVLWLIGNPVNRRLGNGPYLAVYLGTAVALGLIAKLFFTGRLIGASGCIFAVIMIFLMLLPRARVTFYFVALFPITLLVGLFSRPAQWVFWFIRWDWYHLHAWVGLLLVPLLELWGLWTWGLNWTNLGHLLGLICGLIAVLLLPTRITLGTYGKRSYAS